MRKTQTDGQYSLSDYQIPEAQIRIKEGPATLYSSVPISSPDSAARLIGDKLLKDMDREYLIAVSLNNRLQPINYSIVSIGTINQTSASSKEICKSLVLSNAAGFMLMHNHPSGDVDPSGEDRALTAKMVQVGRLIDVPLVDHVIIGGGSGAYYSFAEHGALSADASRGIVQDGSAKYDPHGRHKPPQDRVAELTDKLQAGVADYLRSDRYRQLLDTFSRFHRYSLNNSILIAMQNPAATQVASYTTWQSLGRYPVKGTHGMQIICPAPYRHKEMRDITDPKTGETRKDAVIVQRMGFRVATVFDVSQTDGKPLPEIAPELDGDIADNDLITAVKDAAPPGIFVVVGPVSGAAKGYFSRTAREIRVKDGMSERQTLKTLVHETAHACLHDFNSDAKNISQEDKEIQAESVAYVVCQHYGVDTGDYSFPYIGTWSEGNTKDVMRNLDIVKRCSATLIDSIDNSLERIRKERQMEGTYKTETGYLQVNKTQDGTWHYEAYSAAGGRTYSGNVTQTGLTADRAAQTALAMHGYIGPYQETTPQALDDCKSQHITGSARYQHM